MAGADPSAPLVWTHLQIEPGRSPPSTSPASPTESSEPPPRIGPYVLLRAIGEGAMGVVYAAYDEELERKVALKLIHPSQQGDAQLRTRILREAQALARVSAPNVVHVYQVGEVSGQVYIAMEFINGTTLTKWQAEPARRWQDILRTYVAAGHGLLAAHEAGLIHRDFKPDNVLIDRQGRPRVADFGLARLEAASATTAAPVAVAASAAPSLPSKSAQALLTQAGVVMGTPLYMSPEQHNGDPADARSDQFSFCVALYAALYRQLPFAGDTLPSLAFHVASGQVRPRPAGSHVPMAVHEAILRSLSPNPGARFPSMRELLAALDFDPLSDRTAGPRSRRRVTLSMGLLSGVCLGGLDLLDRLGVSSFQSSLFVAGVFLATFRFLLWRFAGELRNDFHRATIIYGLVYAGYLLSLRGLSPLLGLGDAQRAALDLLALALTTGMMSGLVMPRLWPIIPMTLAGALSTALWPQQAQRISSLLLAAAVWIATYQWNRTVTSRAAARRAAESSP